MDQMKPIDGSKILELEEVKQDVDAGKEPKASVRELLRWFGTRRRGSGVVDRIEAELAAAGLRTDPHFTTTWIDTPVTFRQREPDDEASQSATVKSEGISMKTDEVTKEASPSDMTHLVRMLEAANSGVIYVNPQDSIEKAVTLMLAYDYSQLAVMTGSRDLKGTISWKSIGRRLSQRNELQQVSDAMEQASEVSDADSLFEATKIIIRREYVYVRSSSDRTIIGIVTATDLSEQFQGLSEPFLLLGRIEHQIRRLIDNVFDLDTVRAACDRDDAERNASITKVSQLTFGEYQRIFGKEENWEKLNFVACRKTFCKELDEVRKLRNEIMHFHPDVVDDGDLAPLHRLSRLLEQLDQFAKS
ncbi:CBS domain protein [Pseudovibrio sp. Ad13]|uniref:CBS domain-containing protein n=1 Tax=Pseudovibrio sp. Ad13 TaxID=989396 RepID=UPI0007AE429D|nr:CBS domain-containing protein [Pseudovibrio sp. Ad13]KZK81219.1 CBS domain protein [Pseudovibrio sp. Ad13]